MATVCKLLPLVNSFSSHCSCCSEFELRRSLSELQCARNSLKYPSLSSFQSFISTTSPASRWDWTLNDVYGQRCQIAPLKGLSPSSSTDSPFTERYSPKRTRARGSVSQFLFSAERDVIANETQTNHVYHIQAQSAGEIGLPVCRESSDGSEEGSNLTELLEKSSQLTELREVLSLLRKRREEDEANGVKRSGPGCVFLVGTGPGDPELLTVKGLKLMQTADLVLYDRLVSTDILDMVHAGARLLYVGKTSGFHSRTQEEIHELLLNFAEAGATVVRLKGGDPLVFGRGGEEMDFLREKGIQVKVVPGITAASGIAAELGIPLTHRGIANSVRFLTGHSRKGGDDPLYVTEQAADPDSTLVIYMGLATLPGLATKLMAHGLSPSTPAAAVERGTTRQQRTVFSTLATLPAEVNKAQLVSPTLIFIGQVVTLSPLWPFHRYSESAMEQDHSSWSTTLRSRSKDRVGSGPRDRRERAPDPFLPSQR